MRLACIFGLGSIVLASFSLPVLTHSTPDNSVGVAGQVQDHLAEAVRLELYKAPGQDLMGPWLKRTIEERPSHNVKVWAFFTDKGIGTAGAYQASLLEAEQGWNTATRERRQVLGDRGQATFTDIPVYRPYVNALHQAGFQIHHQSRWLNAVSLRIPVSRLQELSVLPFVRFVQPVLVSLTRPLPVAVKEPLPIMGAAGVDSSTELSFYGGSYTQLDQIQALDLHRAGYTGAGVKVMILDTGFKSSHPAFNTCTNLQGQYDYVFDDGNTENEPEDHPSQHNHGTGVWATLGGYAPGNLIGPAWSAEFYVAKTEDLVNEVHAEEDNYVAALEWADTLGVAVTSASLAYLTFDDTTGYSFSDLDGNTAVITVAVDLAVGKGICCVNAMGNSGPNPSTLWTPADADSVIACGAVNSGGSIASFSSRGPTFDSRIKPEISAMGVGTTWAVAGTDGYGTANGTSLATPLIGGLVALIKEARPTWTGADIRNALMQTGTNMATPDNNIGWGVAQGWDAANFGGGSLAPPLMTLPFALCSPAESSTVVTTTPGLVWGTSEAKLPGDAAAYTVHYQIGAGGAALVGSAGADTTWSVPPAILAPGDTLYWWVSAVGDSGYVRKSMDTRFLVVDGQLAVGDESGNILALRAPYPNPFHQSTRFAWRLDAGSSATFTVFDLQGRIVWDSQVSGSGDWVTTTWDGRNSRGMSVPPGVYWMRAVSPTGTESRKLIKLP